MWLDKKLGSFQRDDHGAVALIFGIAAFALLTTVGLAVDYSRALNVKTSLQHDLDAAVLGAASLGNVNDEQLASAAQAFFDANWKAQQGVTADLTVGIERTDANLITGRLTVNVPTTFMKLAGFENMDIEVASQVELPGKNIEVALVLDTTGSMAGARIEALKTSAKTLIDKAYEGKQPDYVIKFSVVPFSAHVNVGVDNRNAPWMSVPDDSSSTTNVCWDHYEVTGTSNCLNQTHTGYNDGIPFQYQSTTCDYTYAPPVNRCADQTNHSTWSGCAGSRTHPLNTLDEQYSTRIPGIMNITCGQELTPLQDDKEATKAKIDALSASGETYIPAGLIWGWRTLSKHAPFEEASGYGETLNGYPVEKILVLMTDGVNTRSPDPGTGEHDKYDSAEANTLTAETCANIKAQNITIYAVAFEVTDTTIKDILLDCASSASKFFDAGNSGELETAFENIGASLSQLRLSR